MDNNFRLDDIKDEGQVTVGIVQKYSFKRKYGAGDRTFCDAFFNPEMLEDKYNKSGEEEQERDSEKYCGVHDKDEYICNCDTPGENESNG